MQTLHNRIPKPRQLHFDQVNELILDAVSSSEGGQFTISSMLYLGEWLLIFNEHETPITAANLRIVIVQLVGIPIKWVLKNQSKPDHWFGNQEFQVILTVHSSKYALDSTLKEFEHAEQDISDIFKAEKIAKNPQNQVSNTKCSQGQRKIEDPNIWKGKFYEEVMACSKA